MIKINYLVVSLVFASFTSGYYVSSNIYKNKINKINIENKNNEISLLKDLDQIKKDKDNLNEKMKNSEKKSYDKIKEIENKNNTLINDIDNLNVRLFAKTHDSCRETDLSKNKSTSSSNGKTRIVELDRSTSKQLVEITKRADKYKTQLEELQNYINDYNKNIEELNLKNNKK